MRLFIAINFNNLTRSSLLTLRNQLRSKSERGNFSESDNLHLTLAFLGECDAKQIAAVKAIIDILSFARKVVTAIMPWEFEPFGQTVSEPVEKPIISFKKQ